MNCGHPDCTEKHASKFRRSGLCPAAIERERERHVEYREDRGYDRGNEVNVAPERCVAWTAMAGHCLTETSDLACDEHAWDFVGQVDPTRPSILTAEDYALKATMTPEEWTRYRKRAYRLRKRVAAGVGPDRAYTRDEVLHMAAKANAERFDAVRAERREYVLSRLAGQDSISTTEIAERFGISVDTTNRLLADMKRDGLVERSYGGIVSRPRAAA